MYSPRSKGKKDAEFAHQVMPPRKMIGNGNRRSQRLVLTEPVVAYRSQQLGLPFSEGTRTLAVSAHGASISLTAKVAADQKHRFEARAHWGRAGMLCRLHPEQPDGSGGGGSRVRPAFPEFLARRVSASRLDATRSLLFLNSWREYASDFSGLASGQLTLLATNVH